MNYCTSSRSPQYVLLQMHLINTQTLKDTHIHNMTRSIANTTLHSKPSVYLWLVFVVCDPGFVYLLSCLVSEILYVPCLSVAHLGICLSLAFWICLPGCIKEIYSFIYRFEKLTVCRVNANTSSYTYIWFLATYTDEKHQTLPVVRLSASAIVCFHLK